MYLTVEDQLPAVEAEFDDFSGGFNMTKQWQTQLLEQMQITPACNALYAFARKIILQNEFCLVCPDDDCSTAVETCWQLLLTVACIQCIWKLVGAEEHNTINFFFTVLVFVG